MVSVSTVSDGGRRLLSRALTGLGQRWRLLGLASRYAIISGLVMLLALLAVGQWVARSVTSGIVDRHAAAAALSIGSSIAGPLQELRTAATLSREARERITVLLGSASGRQVVGFRIWKDNTIVHVERADVIGPTVSPAAARARAQAGDVVAEYRAPGTLPPSPPTTAGQGLLEVLAPVRATGTDLVIALVETYEVAPALERDVAVARSSSWLLVGLAGLLMHVLQVAAVHRASRVAMKQRQVLADRVEQLSRMLNENNSLRVANQAGNRLAESNERYLRNIGADLHDGPLQLVGMVSLRLDGLPQLLEQRSEEALAEAAEDIQMARESLAETAREIRNIAAGLTLPEIENLPVPEVIQAAVRRHQRHSGIAVALSLADGLPDAQPSLKVCLYRLVQEGLNNIVQHAYGSSQYVQAGYVDGHFIVSIEDDGPGIAATAPADGRDSGAQGIAGLKDRVEALGGSLSLKNRREGGACLSARFPRSILDA